MTWSEEVCTNRIQVARASGARSGSALAGKRRLLPVAGAQPNTGAGPIALVASLLAASLYCSREGHKLRGRRLHPLLEQLRRVLGGGSGGRTTRRTADRPAPQHPAAAAAAPSRAAQAEERRALAAAAAEQRLRAQELAQASGALADGAQGGNGKGAGKKNKKNKGKKKR